MDLAWTWTKATCVNQGPKLLTLNYTNHSKGQSLGEMLKPPAKMVVNIDSEVTTSIKEEAGD